MLSGRVNLDRRANVSSKNISSNSINSDQQSPQQHHLAAAPARSADATTLPQHQLLIGTDQHRPEATSARSSTSPKQRQVEQHLHSASVTCGEFFSSTRHRHTASATRSVNGARCAYGNYYAPYGTTISNSPTANKLYARRHHRHGQEQHRKNHDKSNNEKPRQGRHEFENKKPTARRTSRPPPIKRYDG